MNQASCDRLWQAEASLDGRLDPADMASLDRHAGTCADCARELASLRALADVMAALPDARRSELEQRRARHALLKAADEQLVGSRRAPRGWPSWKAPVFGLAAAACVAGAWLVVGRGAGEARAPAPTAMVEVRDEGAARWTEETTGEAKRVSLQGGKAGFHVDHLRAGARLVVALPDGQIEARGARFVVEVADGRTRGVVVSEGSVAVSVAGYFGVLEAGGRWSPEHASRADADAGAAPPSEGPAGPAGAVDAGAEETARPSGGARRDGGAAAPGVGTAEGASSADAGAESAPPSAGARFAAAMAAFSAGDYGRADSLFAAFVREHPRDGRAEDATFLRADARARRGDTAGAEAAAREYLRAYPRGLRRPEAERLAGGAR